MRMRVSWMMPTTPRKKLTAARLHERSERAGVSGGRSGDVQVVLGLDDQAPPGPDDAGAGQGKVLGKRELFGGAGKVGDAGEDKSPLYELFSVAPRLPLSRVTDIPS